MIHQLFGDVNAVKLNASKDIVNAISEGKNVLHTVNATIVKIEDYRNLKRKLSIQI